MSGVRIRVDGRVVYVGNGTAKAPAGAPSAAFVHGAGMDHTVWTLPARHFARRGWRVLAVDLPGHGRSEGPPLPSIEAMSSWLAAVLDHCEVQSTAVAGHSMGSLVAWEFAKSNPGRCQALALFGTSAPMPVGKPLLAAAADDHHAAIDMANGWSHSPGGTLGANANPGIWMVGTGERLLERALPGVFHADLNACNNYAPTPPAEGDIHCPLLVVAGEADRMTPSRAALAFAEGMPQAQTLVLPGCGHAMLSERPNEVLDALIDAFGAAVEPAPSGQRPSN